MGERLGGTREVRGQGGMRTEGNVCGVSGSRDIGGDKTGREGGGRRGNPWSVGHGSKDVRVKEGFSPGLWGTRVRGLTESD